MPSTIINSDLYQLNLNKAKLKAVTRTSTIFSGFAMVGLVEMSIEINDHLESDIPPFVLHGFTIITCLLIGVHLLALMISTCLLPQIETIVQHYEQLSPLIEVQDLNDASNENAHSMEMVVKMINETKKDFNIRPADLSSPSTLPSMDPQVNLSKRNSYQFGYFKHTLPFNKFQFYIELSWLLSNGFGIFLFLIQVAFVCYIKFSQISNAKYVFISGWIIITIILFIFILFSYRFYILLVEYKLLNKQNDIELLGDDLKNLANLSAEKRKFSILNTRNINEMFSEERKKLFKNGFLNNNRYESLSLDDLKSSISADKFNDEIVFGHRKQKSFRNNSIS